MFKLVNLEKLIMKYLDLSILEKIHSSYLRCLEYVLIITVILKIHVILIIKNQVIRKVNFYNYLILCPK